MPCKKSTIWIHGMPKNQIITENGFTFQKFYRCFSKIWSDLGLSGETELRNARAENVSPVIIRQGHFRHSHFWSFWSSKGALISALRFGFNNLIGKILNSVKICFYNMFTGDEKVNWEHNPNRRDSRPVQQRCRARSSPKIQIHSIPTRPRIGQLPKPGVSGELQVEQEGGEGSPSELEQPSCK